MPLCEGRPNQACPENKNDKSVHLSQGDLMLCAACERARFGDFSQPIPAGSIVGTSSNRAAVKEKSGKPGRAPGIGVDISSVGVSHSNVGQPLGVSAGGADGSMVLNELLCYVGFYRDKSNVDALRRVVLSAFLPANITEAKKVLIEKFRTHLGSHSMLAERRGSSSRAAHEAETDDILGLFDLLDNQKILDNVKFVAANLDLLPKFGPEELNIAAIVDRQVRAEAMVDNLAAVVQQLSTDQHTVDLSAPMMSVQSTIDDMKCKLEAFSQAVDSRLNHLNATCTTLIESTRNVTRITSQPHPTPQPADRNENIIVFGVTEDRDANQWRGKVNDVLQYVADHAVDTVDMYRLGRYDNSKIRPVLVKLRTTWDKRLLLNRCRKLKDYAHRGIYLAPDEPLDIRRKQTLERLQYRAEREGKLIVVSNGVLHIDGRPVFSLADGFVNSIS